MAEVKMVDRRDEVLSSRKSMIEYLESHFRYHTMNSWNLSTSFACNVKVHNLPGLDYETRMKCYEAISSHEAFLDISNIMTDFGMSWDFCWTAGFNGRSDGYIVLYRGGRKENGTPYTYPGEHVGADDYSDWSDGDLNELVEVVLDFDTMCERVIGSFVEFVTSHDFVEEVAYVPEMRIVAKARAI